MDDILFKGNMIQEIAVYHEEKSNFAESLLLYIKCCNILKMAIDYKEKLDVNKEHTKHLYINISKIFSDCKNKCNELSST